MSISGETSTVSASSTSEDTGKHRLPESFFQSLDEIHAKMGELNKANHTLATLTKRAYKHSQQTWNSVQQVDQKVDALIARDDLIAAWRRNLEGRFDALERGQAATLDQINALGTMVKGLTSAVLGTSE